jgi:hypothetical protein
MISTTALLGLLSLPTLTSLEALSAFERLSGQGLYQPVLFPPI